MNSLFRICAGSVAALGLGLVSACGDMDHHMADHAGSMSDAHAQHQELAADHGLPGESIYQLEDLWQDDSGTELPLASLAGQAVVGAMVYGSCEYACPIIVNDMKKIEAELPSAVSDATRFVLFSFDPDRDTPEALAEYRQRRNLLGDNWTTLRAPESTVRELAVVLGVRYKKVGTEFAHSNLIVVFDQDGVPSFRQQGLNIAPDEAVAVLTSIVSTQ